MMCPTKKSRIKFVQNTILAIVVTMGLIISVSCQKKKNRLPANIIPREKMALVIAEIQYADATLITAENQRKINSFEIPEYYNDLLQRFEITKQQFDSSLYYYTQDLEDFAKLYDDVLLILQNKQSQLLESN